MDVILRRLAGVLAGMVTGAAALVLLALAWPARGRWSPRLAALERARLRVFLGYEPEPGGAGTGYLAARAVAGLIGGYATLASGCGGASPS